MDVRKRKWELCFLGLLGRSWSSCGSLPVCLVSARTSMGSGLICLISDSFFCLFVLNCSSSKDAGADEKPSNDEGVWSWEWQTHRAQSCESFVLTGGKNLTFSCMQSEAMAHFLIIFLRQTVKEAVVSVEKQVKDLLQVCHTSGTSRRCLHGWCYSLSSNLCSCFLRENFTLPAFNSTFVTNLLALKGQMDETTWQVRPSTLASTEPLNEPD